MSDTKHDTSKTSSLEDHRKICDKHDDPLEVLCNAYTQARQRCGYRARIFEAGYLPLCKRHEQSKLRAGRCQAVEDCGQLCNYFVVYKEPWSSAYHLCAKHNAGKNNLPCHLMTLPVELRLMILRYLFPDIVGSSCYDVKDVKVAILKANRQLYQEASSVLYGEVRFMAFIRAGVVRIFGRTWHPYRRLNMADSLSQMAVRRIKTLEVEVFMGSSNKNVGYSIIAEEHEIYEVRDTVRKFVEMITNPSDNNEIRLRNLKHLRVQPEATDKHRWSTEEMLAAVALAIEPFCSHLVIEHPVLEDPAQSEVGEYYWGAKGDVQLNYKRLFNVLRDQWVAKLQDFSKTEVNNNSAVKIETLYRQVEKSLQVIRIKGRKSDNYWIETLFDGAERPLHLARIAFENQDMDALENIRNAIGKRWAYGYQKHQRSLQVVSSVIGGMFGTKSNSVRELCPDAFSSVEPYKVLSASPCHRWNELVEGDTAPKLEEPGVTFEEELLRVCIQKDGKKWIRLKTPAMVRQLREVTSALQV
jgi:hypothetical protein